MKIYICYIYCKYFLFNNGKVHATHFLHYLVLQITEIKTCLRTDISIFLSLSLPDRQMPQNESMFELRNFLYVLSFEIFINYYQQSIINKSSFFLSLATMPREINSFVMFMDITKTLMSWSSCDVILLKLVSYFPYLVKK